MIQVGEQAPDFTLPDKEGNFHALSDYKKRWVFLYFYPKDDTTGCTKEACMIRDNFGEFQQHKVVVIGVSVDSAESHKKFAQKYDLPFLLLSDTEKEVVHLYGVWQKKKFLGKEYMGTARSSFLINPSGTIVKKYEKVDPIIHAKEVLEDIRKYKASIV